MEQNQRKFVHPLDLLTIAYERADEEGRKAIQSGLDCLGYELCGIKIGLPIGIAGAVLTGFFYPQGSAPNSEGSAVIKLLQAALTVGTPFLGAKIGGYLYHSSHKD